MRLFDQPVVLFAVLFIVLVAIEEAGIRWRLKLSARIDEGRHEQISAARDRFDTAITSYFSWRSYCPGVGTKVISPP